MSFDNWTTVGGKTALTGVCVHHVNSRGILQDYLIGLPQLHGQHSGKNIAGVVSSIMQIFQINNKKIGYFVLDNALNNNTAISELSEEYNFNPKHRRLRCACHILNLCAQTIIWGKDKDSFENSKAHIAEEERTMAEWRKHGPIGVLFDLISSIITPQARELLHKFQEEEARSLGVKDFRPKELIKPVKTRWNSYLTTFRRAVELQQPLTDYANYKIDEYKRELARSRGGNKPEARLFIQEGLGARDWAIINEYIALLTPFEDATLSLEGRGKSGTHGAIWEVLVTFEQLLGTLEELKDRLSKVDYEDPDAPEDHIKTNCNAAWAKLSEYYAKLDDSPAYYAATRLHPYYKNILDKLWFVGDDDDDRTKENWLPDNNRAFSQL
jgi:hypothetical protein